MLCYIRDGLRGACDRYANADGVLIRVTGKVTRPVKNLRYNESPIFMLNNLMDMGRPERVSASESGGPGQAIIVPPLKCRDFNFTSTSDAI